MTIENEKNFGTRLSAVEIRVSALEGLLNNMIGAASITSKSAKKSSTEKEKTKADLLKKVPYEKKALEGLKSAHLKMLASALNLNSFGIKKDELVKNILEAQKKRNKSGIQDKKDK